MSRHKNGEVLADEEEMFIDSQGSPILSFTSGLTFVYY